MADDSAVIHIRLSDKRTKRLVRWLADSEDMDITEWINQLVNERIDLLTSEQMTAFERYWKAGEQAAQTASERSQSKKAVRKRQP